MVQEEPERLPQMLRTRKTIGPRTTVLVAVAERTHELSLARAAANRAKSGFLAAMSHEIRTPLNGDAYLRQPFTVAAMDAPPVLDFSVIDELRAIGGNEALFRRVLDLFASRVPQAVDRVESLRDTSDLASLADAAHALKSMCANIGARRATAACHDLEHAARTGEAFDAGGKIGMIAAEMLNVMTEIERLRAA